MSQCAAAELLAGGARLFSRTCLLLLTLLIFERLTLVPLKGHSLMIKPHCKVIAWESKVKVNHVGSYAERIRCYPFWGAADSVIATALLDPAAASAGLLAGAVGCAGRSAKS